MNWGDPQPHEPDWYMGEYTDIGEDDHVGVEWSRIIVCNHRSAAA